MKKDEEVNENIVVITCSMNENINKGRFRFYTMYARTTEHSFLF